MSRPDHHERANHFIDWEPLTRFDTIFDESREPHDFVTEAWDASERRFVADRAATVRGGTPYGVTRGPGSFASTEPRSTCLQPGTFSRSPVPIAPHDDAESPRSACHFIDGEPEANNENRCDDDTCYGADRDAETSQNPHTGTHDLVFEVWDFAGQVYEAQKTVTVRSHESFARSLERREQED